MKKILVSASLIFLCGSVFSQIYTPTTPTVFGKNENRMNMLKTFHVPTGTTVTLNSGVGFEGALFGQTSDHYLYYYNGTTWDKMAKFSDIPVGGVAWGSITGTLSSQTDLWNALLAKLNISDTAAMLANYRHWLAGYITTRDRFGFSGEDVLATANRTFDLAGYDFSWNNGGDINTSLSNNKQFGVFTNGTGQIYLQATSGANNSYMYINAAGGLTMSPQSGLLQINNLTNLSTQNRLLGQYGTSKQVGHITVGTGLSLATGVLSNTGAPSTGGSGYIQNQYVSGQVADFYTTGKFRRESSTSGTDYLREIMTQVPAGEPYSLDYKDNSLENFRARIVINATDGDYDKGVILESGTTSLVSNFINVSNVGIVLSPSSTTAATNFFGQNSGGYLTKRTAAQFKSDLSILDQNFANANLTQTAARTYAGAGFDYTFNNLGSWIFNMASGKNFMVYGTGLRQIESQGASNYAGISINQASAVSLLYQNTNDFTEVNLGNNLLRIKAYDGTDVSAINLTKTNIEIKPDGGLLYIDPVSYTLSTLGKKIILRDTTTGLIENIDPALLISSNTDSLFGVQDNIINTARKTNGLNSGSLEVDSLSYFQTMVHSPSFVGRERFDIFYQDVDVGTNISSSSRFLADSRIRGSTLTLSENNGQLYTSNNVDSSSVISTSIAGISFDNSHGIYTIDDLPAAANMTGRRVMVWNTTNDRWEQIVKDSVGGSGGGSFGTDNQIPFTNSGGTNFDYSSNFTFDGAALHVDGAAVFNEAGADKDFRVEGDTDPNLIFVDASQDEVHIGGTSDLGAYKFQVHGDAIISTINATTALNQGNAPTHYNLNMYGFSGAYAHIMYNGGGTGYTDGFLIGTDAGGAVIANYEATPIIFFTSGTERWQINASGHLTATDNTYDIGQSGATRPRNIYIAGTGIFGGDVTVPDEAYDATAWNGSLEVPTKNAIRDKIESLITLSQGEETPTLNNTTNIAASTAYVTNWFRVGDRIHVFGEVSIDATATGAIELRMSLTGMGSFTNTYEAGGTAVCESVAGESLAITAVTSSGQVAFKGIRADITNLKYKFSFSYKYIAP